MKDYLCKKLFNRLSGTLVRSERAAAITLLAWHVAIFFIPRPDTAVSCI